MCRTGFTIVAVVVALVLTQGIAQAQSIQGTWQLMAGSAVDGTPWASHDGLWTVGERHYSYVLVFSPEERQPLPPLEMPGQPTDAERMAFINHQGPFFAQAGTYDLSGTTITFHPIADKVEGPDGYPENIFELQFEGDDRVSVIGPNAAQSRWTYTRVE